MTIPTVDGWIWRSEWEGPGEGPFSIGAKAALVNVVPFHRLKSWVHGRNTSNKDLGWPEARNFLASKRFRFCVACLATGYQASIFQLWGLRTCPIHDQPLHDRCQSCSHPTPLYELRDKPAKLPVLTPTLSCPKCRIAYAGFETALDPRNWAAPRGVERVLSASQEYIWLKSKHFGTGLLKNTKWQPAELFGEESQTEETGRRLCSVFSRMLGYAYDSDSPSLVLGPFGRGCPASVGIKLSAGLSPTQLLVGACEDLQRHKSRVCVPSHGVPVPLSSSVPYMAHAASLWKQQYQPSPIPTVGDFLHISNLTIPDAIGYRAHDCAWVAAQRIAKRWNEQLTAIETVDSNPQRAAALLATSTDWSRRLGNWQKANYSPVLISSVYWNPNDVSTDWLSGPHWFLSVP